MIKPKDLLKKMNEIDSRIKYLTIEYDEWYKYREGYPNTTPYIIRFWGKKPRFYSTGGSWYSDKKELEYDDDYITYFDWLMIDLSGYPKRYDDPEDDEVDMSYCIEELV